MRNLTATLCLTLAVLLFSPIEGWSAEPDEHQFCLSETQHSHYAIEGKCSDSHEAGDYQTALREWTHLAEQGNAFAQFNLGQMYNRGQGVPQDSATAGKWFTLAAEQGTAFAQHNLGNMYANGNGVPKDYVYAYMWWNIAASSGNLASVSKAASINRDKVAEQMTPSQLDKAQDLARECVAKNYKGC